MATKPKKPVAKTTAKPVAKKPNLSNVKKEMISQNKQAWNYDIAAPTLSGYPSRSEVKGTGMPTFGTAGNILDNRSYGFRNGTTVPNFPMTERVAKHQAASIAAYRKKIAAASAKKTTPVKKTTSSKKK